MLSRRTFRTLREAFTRVGVWLLLTGVVSYLISAKVVWEPLHGLLLLLAETALVAFFLSVTVEWWFKQALVQDVFIATLGRIVPPGVISEIKTIVAQQVVIEQYTCTVTLTRNADGSITLRVLAHKRIRNHTAIDYPMGPIVANIDEWNWPNRPSRILQLGYSFGGIDRSDYQEAESSPHHHRWIIPNSQVRLREGQEISTWSESEQTKRENDEISFDTTHAIRNLNILIHAPDDIVCRVYIDRGHGQLPEQGTANYVFTGGHESVLPKQVIVIRWWVKSPPNG